MRGYGWHLFEAICKQRPHAFKTVWIQAQEKPSAQQLQALQQLKQLGVAVTTADKKNLAVLAEGGVHQGIVFEFIPKPVVSEGVWLTAMAQDTQRSCVVLVLDGITDPQNLGAILRSAEGLGATAVLLPQDKAASLTPTALKAASGATEYLEVIVVKNLARSLEALKQAHIWVWGTDLEASENLMAAKIPARVAFVLGREGEGLRHLTRQQCDVRVHIPLWGQGQSLNVSVATGIFLYQYRLQHPA